MFAIFHCTFSHGEMVIPVCCNVHKIYIRTLAKFLIPLFTRVYVSRRKSFGTKVFLTSFSTICFIVTESHYLYSWYVSKTIYSSWTTHAKSYKSHTHSLQTRSCKVKHRLLSCSTGGSLSYNCTFFPFPVTGVRIL